MNWLLTHRTACLLAIKRLSAAPLTALLSLFAIAIALALPVGGWLLLDQLAGVQRGTATQPQLTIFLALDANRKAALDIEARLKGHAEVAHIELLAREATLARMKKQPDLGDVVAALPQNPFPDALIVTPADDRPAVLESLAQEVRQWRHVEHVQVDADWARRLAAFVRLVRVGLTLLAGLLALGLVTITFNTIRMQTIACRAEIEVSRLLGATEGFIRRPFLWYGILLGVLGGAIAWLIVVAALMALRLPVAELAQLYGLDLQLIAPTWGQTLGLLAVAAGLGGLGAALSVRRR